MHRLSAWLGACGLVVPGALVGQLSVGLSVGTANFSGAARSGGNSEEIQFFPYRPTTFGVAVAWGGSSLRLEASARYGEPGLALRGAPPANPDQRSGSVLIVSENAFRMASFSGGGSVPILRHPDGPLLRAGVALVLERWSSPGSAPRTVAGGQGGLAMEVALGSALAARAEAELGFTPASPFRASDVPEGFSPRSTWRRSLAVAVVWWP